MGIEPVTLWSPVRCSNHWAKRSCGPCGGYSISPVIRRLRVRLPLGTQKVFLRRIAWEHAYKNHITIEAPTCNNIIAEILSETNKVSRQCEQQHVKKKRCCTMDKKVISWHYNMFLIDLIYFIRKVCFPETFPHGSFSFVALVYKNTSGKYITIITGK